MFNSWARSIAWARLRIQTIKNCPTYYRENSHHRGYHDCLYIGQSVHAEVIDAQIADLIQSIHLPENWEPVVRQMLNEQHERTDPEAERKELRSMLRLMRDNFERGLYEGEEYQYWQKVSALKEKLSLLERVPEPALNQAARTLLDLRKTWESTTREEQKDLVHIMIQEVGVDIGIKRVLWVKARPDYEPLFSILDGMRQDTSRRFWLCQLIARDEIFRPEEDPEQVSTGIEILLQIPAEASRCLRVWFIFSERIGSIYDNNPYETSFWQFFTYFSRHKSLKPLAESVEITKGLPYNPFLPGFVSHQAINQRFKRHRIVCIGNSAKK